MPVTGGPAPDTVITGSSGLVALAVPEDLRTAPGVMTITLQVTGATVSTSIDIEIPGSGAAARSAPSLCPRRSIVLPVSIIDQLGDIVSNLELLDQTEPSDCN